MRILFFTLSALVLFGCTAPMKYEGPRSVGVEHIFNKDYEIGVSKTVNVGETMVRVRDYWQEKVEEPVAVASKSFTVSGGPVRLEYRGGEAYDIRGKIPVDGADLSVVPPYKGPDYQAALVRDDGSIFNRVVTSIQRNGGQHVMVVYTMQIEPPDAKLERQTSTRVNTTKGFVNYELIYTGANASGLNVTYREFSPDGLARPAFFQNLTYPADAKTITFKQTRLNVDRASAENITFTVLHD